MVGSPRARRALALAREAERRVRKQPSDWIAWLPPQRAFHEDDSRIKLFRTGNQVYGKTWAGLKEIDWWCTGRHPYVRTRRPPIEAWIICASWSQSVAVQKKIMEVATLSAIEPKTLAKFDPEHGFRHANPVIRYKNGSIIRIKTTGQGGLNLSSATIHIAMIDEPTVARIYTEVSKRLMRQGGTLLLTLTPVNGPVDYLRELVAKGRISDHHYKAEARHMIPVGFNSPMRLGDGTPMDEAWIAELRADTLAYEAPVVIDGEWETRAQGQVFTRFNREDHVTDRVPNVDLKICLGMDHGSRGFKQRVVLVGVDTRPLDDDFEGEGRGICGIHVMGEYRGDGATLPETDARGTLDLLRPWGWTWSQVYQARGDHPHNTGMIVGSKSNADVASAIARILGVPADRLSPPIRRVKTGRHGGRGSVYRGLTYLHRAMLIPGRFTVHPSCFTGDTERPGLGEALERWEGADDDMKDPIDALRYAVWQWSLQGRYGGRGQRIYIP